MKKEIIFLVLIIICIFLFSYTIIIFLQNKDVITNDPITYGMKVHNFTTCTCIDNYGNVKTQVSIYDLKGKKLFQRTLEANAQVLWDTVNLPTGSYLFIQRNANGEFLKNSILIMR